MNHDIQSFCYIKREPPQCAELTSESPEPFHVFLPMLAVFLWVQAETLRSEARYSWLGKSRNAFLPLMGLPPTEEGCLGLTGVGWCNSRGPVKITRPLFCNVGSAS